MRWLLYLSLLCTTTTTFSQQFKLSYTSVGLGSNLYSPPYLVIDIYDSLMTYKVYGIAKTYSINKSSGDTIWDEEYTSYKVPFTDQSRDSILYFLKDKEGKYIYKSNPAIMSGDIKYMHIETTKWCTEFSMKNTFDSTALRIANVVNSYLPGNHRIYVNEKWWRDRDDEGLIRSCPESEKSYKEILIDDYELLRKKKTSTGTKKGQ